jgi:hypothetical protein
VSPHLWVAPLPWDFASLQSGHLSFLQAFYAAVNVSSFLLTAGLVLQEGPLRVFSLCSPHWRPLNIAAHQGLPWPLPKSPVPFFMPFWAPHPHLRRWGPEVSVAHYSACSYCHGFLYLGGPSLMMCVKMIEWMTALTVRDLWGPVCLHLHFPCFNAVVRMFYADKNFSDAYVNCTVN